MWQRPLQHWMSSVHGVRRTFWQQRPSTQLIGEGQAMVPSQAPPGSITHLPDLHSKPSQQSAFSSQAPLREQHRPFAPQWRERQHGRAASQAPCSPAQHWPRPMSQSPSQHCSAREQLAPTAPQGPQPFSPWHTSPAQQSRSLPQRAPSTEQHAPSAQAPPQQSLATEQTCPVLKHASGSHVPLRHAQP
jgi:hypothetical protein